MAVRLQIGTKYVLGNDHPTFVIAEIGQNHQGDVNIAKKLIKTAKVRRTLFETYV
jgi:sialic acid synthase